jgi:hypothetical protein
MTYLTAPTAGGGGVSLHSLEIGPTLVRLFYDNFMITLSTDLVQQFYTHEQVRDNQAVMITSLKINFKHFLNEVISKS